MSTPLILAALALVAGAAGGAVVCADWLVGDELTDWAARFFRRGRHRAPSKLPRAGLIAACCALAAGLVSSPAAVVLAAAR